VRGRKKKVLQTGPVGGGLNQMELPLERGSPTRSQQVNSPRRFGLLETGKQKRKKSGRRYTSGKKKGSGQTRTSNAPCSPTRRDARLKRKKIWKGGGMTRFYYPGVGLEKEGGVCIRTAGGQTGPGVGHVPTQQGPAPKKRKAREGERTRVHQSIE